MPRLRWPSRVTCGAAVFLIGVAHRLILFARFADALRVQEQAYPGYLTWQYLTADSFRVGLGASLLYLQQSPPVPNLVIGLIVKATGSTHGSAAFLVLLQGVLSAAAGALLFAIVDRLLPTARWAALVISVLFVLNVDLIVIEYNSLGQTFYEIFSLVLVLALALAIVRLGETPSLRLSRFAGLACALLALTRAPYSLVALPALAAVWLMVESGRLRHSLALLGTIALLHGGWTLKNVLVYGTPSPLTSSWGGANLTQGMMRANYGEPFRASILAEPERYPEWFSRMIRDRGMVLWHPPDYFGFVPDDVKRRDQEIQASLGGRNRSENSVAMRTVSAVYLRAHIRFAVQRPDIVLHRFAMSYRQFWEPIGGYGSMFISLLTARTDVTNSFDVPRAVAGIIRGRHPEPELQVRYGARVRWQRASFFVPAFAAPVILLLNVVAVHALLPVALLGTIVSWMRGRRPSASARFVCAMGILYVYAALTFNIAEYGENMRYRVSIEPVIWILSTVLWTSLLMRGRSTIRAIVRRRQVSDPV